MMATALECLELGEEFQMFSQKQWLWVLPSMSSVSQDSLGCRNTVFKLPQAESAHLPIYPQLTSKHRYRITDLL